MFKKIRETVYKVLICKAYSCQERTQEVVSINCDHLCYQYPVINVREYYYSKEATSLKKKKELTGVGKIVSKVHLR